MIRFVNSYSSLHRWPRARLERLPRTASRRNGAHPRGASGNFLVCLDVDMKHASGPTNVAIQRMAKYVKQKQMLTEVSVSGRGRHVFLWVKAPPVKDLILPKYKLGGGQELEVFGLPNSAGKSVLLSGNAVAGEFQEAVDLFDLLQEWGIIEQHQLQEPKPTQVATQAFDFSKIMSNAGPSDFDKAIETTNPALAEFVKEQRPNDPEPIVWDVAQSPTAEANHALVTLGVGLHDGVQVSNQGSTASGRVVYGMLSDAVLIDAVAMTGRYRTHLKHSVLRMVGKD